MPDDEFIRVVQHYSRSGEFPDGKPLYEQDELLVDDVQTYMAMIAREEWLLTRKGDEWSWSSEDDDDEDELESDDDDGAMEGVTPLPLFGR